MERKYRTFLIIKATLLSFALMGFLSAYSFADETESLDPNQRSKYLDAVREFADNVLKYGRDTYGSKHTPLFVDGLMVRDPNNPNYGKDGVFKPVEWIDPDGTKWPLSNFANQQTLMRTLDGLSNITGDPKYRQAAIDAIRYEFDHLRTPIGLFYWGHMTAYDALGDTPRGNTSRESIKLHYPYYELMWKVDPEATKKIVEALWCAHVMDWSNLDLNRIGITAASQEEPWNHEYKGGPTFFKSKHGGGGFFVTATSLVQAGTTLYRLSSQEQPLVWSKRLAKRFVDTRNPKTGIGSLIYNNPYGHNWLQLGDDMKEHFLDPYTTVWPWDFYEYRYLYYPESAQAHPWMSIFLAGKMLGEEGEEFTRWALEELTAWGKASYRKRDNSFVPMLTDGTSLEGYVWKKGPANSSGLNVIKPYPADPSFFWAYSVGYSATGDKFMWQMLRNIALGNGFGDIGHTPAHTPELQMETACSHVYGLLGFLELYAKTKKPGYLQMSRRIGDNILLNQFHKGFFVPSKKHIYTRFDCFEPLALLHLDAATKSTPISVPQVWPSIPLFVPPYRHKQEGEDRRIIYALTESPEPPISLQEAAAIGDVKLVRTLIENGTDVDSLDDGFLKTALHRAAISGYKDVAELLLAKGAYVDARDWDCRTPLHYTAEHGHKDVAELLLAKGADVNGKDMSGDMPIQYAARYDHKDIIELLLEKGATISTIHLAAYMGDLAKLEAFIQEGVDINGLDGNGYAPLHYAVQNGQKEAAELLIAKGADVNAKDETGYTPLHYAARAGHKDIIELLIANGADVNVKNVAGETPLHRVAEKGYTEIAELLIGAGADVNAKNNDGQTPVDITVSRERSEVAKLLIEKGADVSFHAAAHAGALAKVKSLIETGADINAKDTSGLTPLYYAAHRGHKEVVELLLAKGAVISTVQEAAYVGDLEKVKAFIQEGINVNSTDLWGSTALHFAARGGHRNVVDLLISKGADVNAMGNNDWPPLCIAVSKDHVAVAEYLIAHGADVNPDNYWTPLQEAPYASGVEMVELLISKGADVNAGPWTALHGAVDEGCRDIVEVLLAKGADVNAKDGWCRAPLWYAKQRGYTEIVELLRKYGAKEDGDASSSTDNLQDTPQEDKTSDSTSSVLDKMTIGIVFLIACALVAVAWALWPRTRVL